MTGKELRLLALDGGGVRGLSSLMILEQLMQTIDRANPPKPCEYFDMIGGTSTGGLIAIMLGRLEMTIDECIDAYLLLSNKIFQKKAHRVTIQGKIQGRFDAKKLEEVIKEVVTKKKLPADTLLKSAGEATCKVWVEREINTPRGNNDLLNTATIWEACRATSAASSFFDPIAIGRYGEEFVDGGTGANNPVWEVWNQAQAIYGPNPLEDHLDCLVSIGTGVPSLTPFRDDVLHIHETLIALATETEQTAERFRRSKAHLDDSGHYYRFNVARGLEEVGLEESKKKKEIAVATRRYVASQEVLKQMQACADRASRKQFSSKYHIPFSLRGVPMLDKFADRPAELAALSQSLLPQRGLRRRRIFVLSGMGGMGKTQLAAQFARRHHERYSAVFWLDGSSEDSLRQSIASAATRIPAGQIPEATRTAATSKGIDLEVVVECVLDWLSLADNDGWLVVLDNVDREYRPQAPQPGSYDIGRYFPEADHGSILVTTRLGELEQQGTVGKKLRKVDASLAEAMFRQWYTGEFNVDMGSRLIKLLDGLPLALTQAAAYIQQTRTSFAQYINLYNTQWKDLMESQDKDGIPLPAYHRSIWRTWTISYEAIRAKNEAAANLLLLWAFLDYRDLWYGLFVGIEERSILAGQDRHASLREICRSEVAFNRAISLLINYCLVESMESLAGYTVHPVVHQWARHVQSEERRLDFARVAVTMVGHAVPSNSERDFWIVQTRLLGHAECCFQWITEDWCQLGKWQDVGNQGETIYDEKLDDIHDALLGLGNLYRDQGKLVQAETMYQRALQGYEKALGQEHTSTLDTINNLGGLYADQGKLAQAESMYQRALQGYEKALGQEHTSTLNTVNNLGNLYADQGKLSQVESMYRRALQGYEKALGEDLVHESMPALNTYENLAHLLVLQGQHVEATELFKRALAGLKKVLGSSHERCQHLESAMISINPQ
ncbi:hypothetical protein LTR20_007356 [Exophiala xenobiotica]|nr:hypothetical protein LTS06_008050 [Exophiala xenobiotica]KAK5283512.1 hypothetical protein LTR40_001655 [Exophiala xenobiotica]KAK5371036.1 hypothetical protein LTS13_006413 [Exophiala xenobiotica]KAK5401218.1 hypothetical protein LTR79_001737 [Exophiala xenobiotica]KAK5409146.1 hypothetical protein LTR90_009269 [Exophiala xenobiotica]